MNRLGNPVTQEELGRLNHYLAKARGGEFFSTDEVLDYNSLVSELEKHKKGDPSVWPFVALGALLAGLFGVSKN